MVGGVLENFSDVVYKRLGLNGFIRLRSGPLDGAVIGIDIGDDMPADLSFWAAWSRGEGEGVG